TATTTAPGTYTLFVKADGRWTGGGGGTNTDNGRLVEANEANNTQALTLTLPVKPDLTVSNASIGVITVNQNGVYNIPVTFTVTNVGGVTAPPSWYDEGYLSVDGVLDNADLALSGYVNHTVALAPGASYTTTTTFGTATTTAPGTYTLFVKADGQWVGGSGTNTDNGRF